MTKEELIYLAGFIDGEGCIRIQRHQKNFVSLTVEIVNTNEQIIRLIAKWFKGNVRCREGKGNWKNVWVFYNSGKNAAILLEAVYPYLLIKKEQVYIGLEFNKLIMRRGAIKGKWGTNLLPQENHEQREKLANQINILNHKGTLIGYHTNA
jgi:hypothetical protein